MGLSFRHLCFSLLLLLYEILASTFLQLQIDVNRIDAFQPCVTPDSRCSGKLRNKSERWEVVRWKVVRCWSKLLKRIAAIFAHPKLIATPPKPGVYHHHWITISGYSCVGQPVGSTPVSRGTHRYLNKNGFHIGEHRLSDCNTSLQVNTCHKDLDTLVILIGLY